MTNPEAQSTDALDLLRNDGPIANRLESYEERPEQLSMARAVQDALARKHHLLVEAGTGVGKSFAYLIPAIMQATAGGKRDKPVVISTGTIALQEQLIRKDIPFLRSVWDREFTAVLAKGRGNYISRRRLAMAGERARQGELFESSNARKQLEEVTEWCEEQDDGSRSGLSFSPEAALWDQIVSDSNNCLGKKCPTYESCFFQRARRRVYNAHILIVNHHLLFADLALRVSGVSLLPDYDNLIIDEAHDIENVASESLGIKLSRVSVEFFLRRLHHPRTGRGLFSTYPRLQKHDDILLHTRDHCATLFDDILQYLSGKRENRARLLEPHIFKDAAAEAMRTLYFRLSEEERVAKSEEEGLEIGAAAKRALALSSALENFVAQSLPDQVYWIERSDTRGGNNVELRAAPIHVGSLLKDHLFTQVGSVVLTSATLATGGGRGGATGSFGYIRDRLGMEAASSGDLLTPEGLLALSGEEEPEETSEDEWPRPPKGEKEASAKELLLGSPFDYESQAELWLPDLPEPNSSGYDDSLKKYVIESVKRSEGGVFVLFTSYTQLRKTYESVRSELDFLGFSLLRQGDGVPRERLLEAFKAGRKMVLFGTDSFWQGIDVPGNALTTVIIAKLPFAVPTDPLVAARMEAFERLGRSSFMEYSLPQAIIKLKQGFGRLIRRKTDSGVVAILDSRIRRKSYGRKFVDALPPARLNLE